MHYSEVKENKNSTVDGIKDVNNNAELISITETDFRPSSLFLARINKFIAVIRFLSCFRHHNKFAFLASFIWITKWNSDAKSNFSQKIAHSHTIRELFWKIYPRRKKKLRQIQKINYFLLSHLNDCKKTQSVSPAEENIWFQQQTFVHSRTLLSE